MGLLLSALLAAPLAPVAPSPDQALSLRDTLQEARLSYTESPVAVELCPLPGPDGSTAAPSAWAMAASLACQLGRSQYAVGQGALLRTKALNQGAQCELFSIPADQAPASLRILGSAGMWVCFEFASPLVQRGGTTYGDTFFFAGSRDQFDHVTDQQALLRHEAQHVIQWHLFGRRFPTLYAVAGPNACRNQFEIAAGLSQGGYQCDPEAR